MPQITPNTVADLIFWSYANLAMAHDGIKRGIPTYDKTSFIIRTRLSKGLQSGQFQIGTLFEDERWKMENGARCVYCGTTENLSVDHLFARIKGGEDNPHAQRLTQFVGCKSRQFLWHCLPNTFIVGEVFGPAFL